MDAIALILARELRNRDIDTTVNTVAPGPVGTEMFLDRKDEQTVARIADGNPMERLGRPEDISPRLSPCLPDRA